jgi:EPS-associated MarR family transcriptional regulator
LNDQPAAAVGTDSRRRSERRRRSFPTASRFRMLTDEYRYKLLRLLEANPQISQRELARALGISLGRVNFCLNALIEKGLIKARNFTNSNSKRAYMYYLTPRGLREKARVTVRFLHAKLAEYEQLQGEIDALRRDAERAGIAGDPRTVNLRNQKPQ